MERNSALSAIQSPFRSPPSSPSRPGSKLSVSSPASDRRCSVGLDRFIPPRSPLDPDYSNFLLLDDGAVATSGRAAEPGDASPIQQGVVSSGGEYEAIVPSEYETSLRRQLLQDSRRSNTVLPLTSPSRNAAASALHSPLPLFGSDAPPATQSLRSIPTVPERILDIPELVDDYYLNLVDWSKQNVISIALNKTLYLWNATTGVTTPFMTRREPDNIITSIKWAPESREVLAVGLDSSIIELHDVQRNTLIRTLPGHSGRVSSFSWTGSLLSSGSRDSRILHHDIRAPRAIVARLERHSQEVCGLQWSPNGLHLASGGNDNLLCLWDARQPEPQFVLDRHKAAVKALGWCPHQPSLLASGGGTADRRICFWNTTTGSILNEIDTKSQVCAIQWSVHDRQLVSSHGFTHNQLILWKHHGSGRVSKVIELTGHTSRVLHLAQSPDGTTVVSASPDDTLRFWRIFGSPTKSPSRLKQESSHHGLLSTSQIR
jgi:cell division cycle protein 20 (cofactor of APC complex)